MGKSYTTSTAFLEALQEAGVSYIFANLGSDHPALVESLALAKKENRHFPEVITSPHEMVALSAANGYAQVTGEPQAVLVHVECGTQNLGGAIHNAAKGRVPVLIFAGASPYTQEGELLGSRNEFIHWIQDVHDQRGIIRGYTKYDNEIRTGKNVKQLVHRALQIAQSDPKGPVYLMGPREVMEEDTVPVNINLEHWQPTAPNALPTQGVQDIVYDLVKAKHPLVVTSYLGRNKKAVEELVTLCNTLAIPVLESVPNYINFPSTNPMQCGYQWNSPEQNELLAQADVLLVLDSDIPWIAVHNRPAKDCIIYHIDIDPLKEQMPLWYIPAKQHFAADAKTALQQINEFLRNVKVDEISIEERRDRITKVHKHQREQWERNEQYREDIITPEYLTACIREIIDDETIIINEGISNYETIYRHIKANQPGMMIGSGAGSLGWNGGAAIGAKLAAKDKTVINLTGDGSYLFSVPSTVHWMSRKYNAPFLTVIYNNRGWKSPKLSTLGVHPDGVANEMNTFFNDFDPPADLAKIAESAGGAYAQTVKDPSEIKGALRKALTAVKEGRSAVLDVYLPAINKEIEIAEKVLNTIK
ncbi:thiamine pyrophosphate-requiring protein [Niallia endozanthoxylica]|uniref:Thiamine pyrophosphate-requiring protein n=1 Tax=Niallia endozanthoxylica TaxID=2036016 RepID=A0A5J5HPB6_9BACI|nr:thiamine pyrophosphate-requiring protein [Niallia endozanthoxylica]KAA9023653.1 thiamine pyrophosphate-requiring protein [Niallia endozanthoxylica]